MGVPLPEFFFFGGSGERLFNGRNCPKRRLEPHPLPPGRSSEFEPQQTGHYHEKNYPLVEENEKNQN